MSTEFEITAELPHIGIDSKKIPEVDPMKVRDNEESYIMLLNTMKTSSEAYQKATVKIERLNNRIKQLEIKNTEHKSSVIIMSIAEIVTAIGVGGIYTEYFKMSIVVIFLGIVLTILALYFNFKKKSLESIGGQM